MVRAACGNAHTTPRREQRIGCTKAVLLVSAERCHADGAA